MKCRHELWRPFTFDEYTQVCSLCAGWWCQHSSSDNNTTQNKQEQSLIDRKFLNGSKCIWVTIVTARKPDNQWCVLCTASLQFFVSLGVLSSSCLPFSGVILLLTCYSLRSSPFLRNSSLFMLTGVFLFHCNSCPSPFQWHPRLCGPCSSSFSLHMRSQSSLFYFADHGLQLQWSSRPHCIVLSSFWCTFSSC